MTVALTSRPLSASDAEYRWNWSTFVGDPATLRYAKRELVNVDKVLRYVEKPIVAVQAGGNLGVFPKFLAQRFSRVMTFEPDNRNFVALTMNAQERNIVRFQAALGEHQGYVGLSRERQDRKLVHDGIVHIAGDGAVPMMRIDDLLLGECSLIYLDLEGYELFALRGAERTIADHRPVIAVEVNRHLERYGFTEADIAQFFQKQRYTYVAQYGSDKVFIPAERAA